MDVNTNAIVSTPITPVVSQLFPSHSLSNRAEWAAAAAVGSGAAILKDKLAQGFQQHTKSEINRV